MYNSEIKSTIIKRFHELSIEYGFKKVTVDMIAQKCGISKKTIYKYFNSKDEIIEAFAEYFINNINYEFDKITDDNITAKEKMTRFFDLTFQIVTKIPKTVADDANKYYPEIVEKINYIRDKYTRLSIETIKEGIKTGAFKDVDPAFMEGFYMGAASMVFNPEFQAKNNLSYETASKQFIDVLFSGILKKNDTNTEEKILP